MFLYKIVPYIYFECLILLVPHCISHFPVNHLLKAPSTVRDTGISHAINHPSSAVKHKATGKTVPISLSSILYIPTYVTTISVIFCLSELVEEKMTCANELLLIHTSSRVWDAVISDTGLLLHPYKHKLSCIIPFMHVSWVLKALLLPTGIKPRAESL